MSTLYSKDIMGVVLEANESINSVNSEAQLYFDNKGLTTVLIMKGSMGSE